MKNRIKIISACLIIAIAFGCCMPMGISASGTNPDMINFHISSSDTWMALKYVKGNTTFAAGNYKATLKFKLNSGEMPKIAIGENESASSISKMTNVKSAYDSQNYVYTITFTLDSSWTGYLGWYIGNYGKITDFFVSDPQIYLLDSKGNNTGSNLVNTFAESYYVSSRTADRWIKAGFTSERATISAYNADTFAPRAPKMLKLGGAAGMQALCFERTLTKNTYYQFDMDYRACGGVEAYKDIKVIDGSGKYATPSYDNWTLVSWNDTGTHLSIRFKVPSKADSTKKHFRLYIGQNWPQTKNGIVYFANFSLYKLTDDDGVTTGSNIFENGDFAGCSEGTVTSETKDTVFSDFEQIKVMDYADVSLQKIPEGFFDEDTNLKLDKAYRFKGGDMYKPQFNFEFAASTTYRLIYDYYCDDLDTVNAYIFSKDNSLSANKVSRITNGRFEAVYDITTSSDTKGYTDSYLSPTGSYFKAPNGSIRFALNGNNYDKEFYISNIRLYKLVDGQISGTNLIYPINPVLDDDAYGFSNSKTSLEVEIARDDTELNYLKSKVACCWMGNLNYTAKNTDAYSYVEKINEHKFDYYSHAQRLTNIVNCLIEVKETYNPYSDTESRFYDPNDDGSINILDLIQIKKDALNASSEFAVANEQTNGGIYPTFDTITCYGDSLTQGMGYESTPQKNYPSRLNSYIGSGYTVINAGDPGEKSYTIMARQGALSLTTSNAISFPASTKKVKIGTYSDNGFITSKGDYIDLTGLLGNENSINNITINGNKYIVSLTDFVWNPRSYNVWLERVSGSSALTIPKGSAVTFNNYSRQDECEIYYIGANGDYNNDRYNLIAQYKAMIDRHGSNNFLIIIPHFYYCPREFKEAFGDHCVDFTSVACSDAGFTYEGLTKTTTDIEWISQNKVPPSFRLYPSNPDVHLNDKGYDLLAHVIHEQGKTLGYFSK